MRSRPREDELELKKTILDTLSEWIAARITSQSSGYEPYTPSDPESLRESLQTGDVLLVEGNQKVSSAIKYLTQSTWSHAALYVGDALPEPMDGSPRHQLIEVILGDGCISVPLERYQTFNTRICRPVGLSDQDRATVVQFMVERIGLAYDVRNILDLARYLFPTPPVPTRWRRKMIAFGSGDPTRAICSTLIAEAYQSVNYPILPDITALEECLDPGCETYARSEILHIRHHSLFAPRDFDLSPYFQIIKPTIRKGFDYKELVWHDPHPERGVQPKVRKQVRDYSK